MAEGNYLKHPNNDLAVVKMPLQLLLFVNHRPSTQERARQVLACLDQFQTTYPFELEIIDVSEQPYLAEHYRLIATPALIKIHPEPRHTLAGSDLVEQLQHWWSFWQQSAEAYAAEAKVDEVLTEAQDLTTQLPPVNLDAVVELSDRRNLMNEMVSPITSNGSAKPLIGKAYRGAPLQIQSLARFTELIQLSDEIFQLKKEKEELEHQIKFKDQIIAMLAHDLRNPLTAASLALETLEMGHSPETGWNRRLAPPQINQLLLHARNQIKAIDRMITDILSRMEVQPQCLDLRQLCLDVSESLGDRIAAKSLKLVKDIPSDLPLALADDERTKQVLVNLLDNAIKYTPPGGSVTLAALHRKTQEIWVSISDNGPGIPLADQERIFDDRYRLRRDANTDGYGIGLALCRRIVRAHCGKIWVDSTPGQGSSFNFTLPVFKP